MKVCYFASLIFDFLASLGVSIFFVDSLTCLKVARKFMARKSELDKMLSTLKSLNTWMVSHLVLPRLRTITITNVGRYVKIKTNNIFRKASVTLRSRFPCLALMLAVELLDRWNGLASAAILLSDVERFRLRLFCSVLLLLVSLDTRSNSLMIIGSALHSSFLCRFREESEKTSDIFVESSAALEEALLSVEMALRFERFDVFPFFCGLLSVAELSSVISNDITVSLVMLDKSVIELVTELEFRLLEYGALNFVR